MGYDWAERYVLKNRNYIVVLVVNFFFLKNVYNMYISISVECSFEESLLMVSIHHHAAAHIM